MKKYLILICFLFFALTSCNNSTPQRVCFLGYENEFLDSTVIVTVNKEEEYFNVICKTESDNKDFHFKLYVDSKEVSGLTYYNKTKGEYFEFVFNETQFSKDTEFIISYTDVSSDIKLKVNEDDYHLFVFGTAYYPRWGEENFQE